MITEVFCTLQVEGMHFWADCPIKEVSYLRHPHRHVFHIKAYKAVEHSDRDVEFIVLKHDIRNMLTIDYWDDDLGMHNFEGRSCEMIAEELITMFKLTRCEVSEDGENGAIVRRT